MVWIHKRRKGEGKQLYVKGARQKEKFYSRSCFFDIFFSTWPRVELFFLPAPFTESCFPSPLLLLWISTICCSTILTELNWVDQDLSENIVTKQMLPGMVKVSLLFSLKFSVIFSATWQRRTLGAGSEGSLAACRLVDWHTPQGDKALNYTVCLV